ncbi:MAG: EutN/CcmL family microcompartment protein [Myxococcota bacterium]|nr:EutN/CcmL family microcompartment protein [Myxococcota bacterium]MDW8362370.1 EutN/CcmL family microcompartment protein [Myxococcales bacterium]
MKLGRVRGTVVSTAHHPAYDGHKVLLVDPVDERGQITGEPIVAVDHVQAGVGDWVLVNQEGGGTRLVLTGRADGVLPIRSLVVGIVDEVDVP